MSLTIASPSERVPQKREDEVPQGQIPDTAAYGRRALDCANGAVQEARRADGGLVLGAGAAARPGGRIDRAFRTDRRFASPATQARHGFGVFSAVERAVFAGNGDRSRFFQGRAAFAAEFLVVWVLRLAFRANHCPFSSRLRSIRRKL